MQYILFGAGEVGRQMLRVLQKERVVAFCDNNKTGEMVEGIPVVSVEEVAENFKQFNSVVVICTVKKSSIAQISKQLVLLNIPFLVYDELMSEILKTKKYVLVGREKDVYKHAVNGGCSRKTQYFPLLTTGI